MSFTVTPSTQSIRCSLRTSDTVEAKARQGEAAAYVERYFESVRRDEPVTLSHRQKTALVGELYAAWASGPDGVRTYSSSTTDSLLSSDEEAEMWAAVSLNLAEQANAGGLDYALKTYGPIVDRMLAQKGIAQVRQDDREYLAVEFSKRISEAAATSSRIAGGDYSLDPQLSKFPPWEAPERPSVSPTTARSPSKVSLEALLGGWWTEAKAAGKSESTYESYSNTFRLFSAFLGHDDARKVTPEDVIRYKNHRLSAINAKTKRPVSAKTVKASDLTALKSVFDWGVTNLKVASNPASGVTVKLGRKTKIRERDFTPEEATSILRAAASLAGNTRTNQTLLAKRWVPWQCAYTGCRVGELVQLRKEDVRREGDKWAMTITPEAGVVKGKEARDIPLHDHLVEMGFTEFVQRASTGYLFMTIKDGSTFRGGMEEQEKPACGVCARDRGRPQRCPQSRLAPYL